MIIILTGVPGSGKGKVIELVKRKLNVSVLNFGDFIFHIAQDSGLVKDRDEMRDKISITQTRSMQKSAADTIAAQLSQLGDNVIIDTHCAVRSPAGYFPGLPSGVLSEIKPHSIVIREAKPEVILERRKHDKDKGVRSKRDMEDIFSVSLHQQLNRSFAAAYCAISGATLRVLIDREKEDHPYQNAEAAAEAILNIFAFK